MDTNQLQVLILLGIPLFGIATGDFDSSPIIKSIPTTVRVREHESVLLPCYVDNLASKVTWKKEDDIIAQDSTVFGSNLVLFANNTLEVSDVTAADTGHYTCVVTRTHPWGPINQQHAIEVLYPPRLNMTPTGEVEVELDEEVTISCFADGSPKPEIKWLFKGEELKIINQRNVLQFIANRGSLTGEYSCEATNGVGDDSVASVFIRVICK
ncbi:hypothetical protein GE061_010059 [Apolygus lucorum]|uniref:Ig-like domain-containing protein n=1 Tax=Apolygus lucorum TaxID=248454 RepID=A0A8S9Y264_APOLU|nr:hypothetical protein GE061_010059 [Apolygus lucorum]